MDVNQAIRAAAWQILQIYGSLVAMEWPKILSWVSMGMFGLGLVGVYIGFCVPMSAQTTRRLCNTGIIGFQFLSLNCVLLYVWHHFWR